jgi:hypothetical protein
MSLYTTLHTIARKDPLAGHNCPGPIARDHLSGKLMPQAGSAGCSLTSPGQDPRIGSMARSAQTGDPKRPLTAGPTQLATLHLARRSTTRGAQPLDGL